MPVAKEINGQTNHLKNQLLCKDDTCELTVTFFPSFPPQDRRGGYCS